MPSSRSSFPNNAVRYFVSYYDYYQPEAYIPQRDIYIEKDASINEEIERLRLACTSALVSRDDVIVVASVSCIYGLGSPEDYRKMMVRLQLGDIDRPRRDAAASSSTSSTSATTSRSSAASSASAATCVELWPAYEEFGYRIELFGDEVERLATIDPLTGDVLETHRRCTSIRPSTSSCPKSGSRGPSRASSEELERAARGAEGAGQAAGSPAAGGATRYDMEMLLEVGYCSGIENYCRPLSRAASRARRPTRCSTSFPPDSLLFIDESHVTVPQIRGMFAGDFSRKSTLVEHGFRLPSALDNRPLRFDEWETEARPGGLSSRPRPGDYEIAMSGGEVVEQVIRPDRLIDPRDPSRAGARPGARLCSRRSRHARPRASAC